MKYDLTMEPGGRFVHIVASGEIQAAETARMAKAGLALAREAGCRRYLIDYRQTTVADTTIDTYEFMSNLEKIGITRKDRIAFVMAQDEDAHRFAETVARNRGSHIRYFIDSENAVDWLGAGA